MLIFNLLDSGSKSVKKMTQARYKLKKRRVSWVRDRLETRAENDIIWRQTRKRSQLWLIGVGRPFTTVKFIYSEKATKIWRDLQTSFWSYYVMSIKSLKISSNFCGLLRIYELYRNYYRLVNQICNRNSFGRGKESDKFCHRRHAIVIAAIPSLAQ